MKTTTLFFVLALWMGSMISAQATTWTVSKDPSTIAQYTDGQTAHDAASAGDTLLIHGASSTLGYYNINVTKQLVIIGTGSYDADRPATNCAITVQSGGSGSTFACFNGSIIGNSSLGNLVTAVKVYKFIGGIGGVGTSSNPRNSSNWTIKHSIITSFGNLNSSLVYSCVFHKPTGQGTISSCDNTILVNNHFVHDFGDKLTYNSNNCTFQDNSIYRGSLDVGCTSCLFNNNVFTGSSSVLPYTNNSGANNQYVTDLGQTTGPGWGQGNPYNINTTGYTLTPTSPCKGAAMGGGDVGIYGHADPMPTNNGFPYSPQITAFGAYNTIVPQGGQLHIEGSAKVNK